MHTSYHVTPTGLVRSMNAATLDQPMWFDLAPPDRESMAALEELLGIDVPELVERQELEPSKRLRHQREVLILTVSVPATDLFNRLTPLTFLVGSKHLATLREGPESGFHHIDDIVASSPLSLMLKLLERVVARVADQVELIGGALEKSVDSAFDPRLDRARSSSDVKQLVHSLGVLGSRLMKLGDCLTSLSRLGIYLSRRPGDFLNLEPHDRDRLEALLRDARALQEYVASLDNRIDFTMNATLGLVAIEQNDVMKLISVATVIFLPPTLIASIYGMNFDQMPELDWRYGFAAALAVMFGSALASYLIFRWRRWL